MHESDPNHPHLITVDDEKNKSISKSMENAFTDQRASVLHENSITDQLDRSTVRVSEHELRQPEELSEDGAL
ncbi:hypothetical protein QJS10_CPA03g02382 [Acorus calamus]|uniref:Uncharacterized protein n=1 Tax=Acorus calamus TaxID=4465 RepID=A0AAV9F4S8_ACOCL|nr:hypothetical protein QJS10_CPA03g02382 [Acorus calamus]